MKHTLLKTLIVAAVLVAGTSLAYAAPPPPVYDDVTYLPDPTVWVDANGDPTVYPLASHHDDFWSYSGPVLTHAGYQGFTDSTGTGTLDLLVYTGGAVSNKKVVTDGIYEFPDALNAPGGSTPSYGLTPLGTYNTWGLGNTVPVTQLLDYLQKFDPNNVIPVFTFDLNEPKSAAEEDLYVAGEVRVVTAGGTVLDKWVFDNGEYYDGGVDNFPVPQTAPNNTLELDKMTLAQGTVALPDGFTFDNNAGSGKLEYIAYSPTMDLSNPLYKDAYFEAQFYLDDIWNGYEELFLTGRFAPSPSPGPEPVPEPATVLLLGTGLLGFGAVRRKKA